MVGVKVEHVLMLVIVIFVIYYLIGSCDCTNGLVGVDGFNVGVQENNCHKVLESNCSNSFSLSECKICAGKNQTELKHSGCTNDYIQNYCKKFTNGEKKSLKDYFNDLIQFINGNLPESFLTIVIIVCIAYIISKIIDIFKVNVNLSF
tara:strand:- start:3722 stop:4165 length:444 start_codon:yes stop_codon:yes gene_type:complete